MNPQRFVPLSVRYGNRRKKFGWWVLGRREAVALRLAPWLNTGHSARDADPWGRS